MLLQLLLGQERRAVDALHRLVARVALPVGVRRGQQLERLQLAGRRHVRADAEVDEGLAVLDRVAGDLGLAFGLLVDQLHLQRLAARAEERAWPRRAATAGARRADPAAPARASSSRWPRCPRARTGAARRSRRRTLRRWPGRCRTATPGKRLVTAAASRCAVLWRYSASASGLSSVTMRTEASAVERKRQIDQRAVDHRRPAPPSPGAERSPAATSRTGVPARHARLDPSGSVTVTSTHGSQVRESEGSARELGSSLRRLPARPASTSLSEGW